MIYYKTYQIFVNSLLIFIISVISSPVIKKNAYADNLSSPEYRIQMGTINITGGNKTGGGFKLSDTVGQTAQGLFSNSGYKIRAGFQYIHSIIPFSFIISSLNVNLGNLQPNSFSTANHTLTIKAGGAYGYAVKAIENNPLKSQSGAIIPDTTCNPATPCTHTNANVWTSTTAYGFGYNAQGDDVTPDFIDGTYFRPFPNNSQNQSPATIMTKSGITIESQSTVTYQANVSPTQEGGEYENAIQYLAIPAY